jgi:hypothetical protein
MIGRHWRFSVARFFVAVGLAAIGCSGSSSDDLPREAVSGTVTLDGKPLVDGSIQFAPAADSVGPQVGGGSPIADGQFSISRENGLVPGAYKVSINAGDAKREEQAKGPVRKGLGLAKELIPAKYNSQTTLSAEVNKGGSDNLNFDLQSK